MRLLGDGGLPGRQAVRRHVRVNQVRIRAPHQPAKAWQLTQAVVARLGVQRETGSRYG